MFKKLIISLGVLVFLIVALMVVFFTWAKNPYGLEPERLGPKGGEALPTISTIPNAKNYLLFSKYEQNNHAIHLALPNDYIHESNTTQRISKSYSAYVTMYYPNMNGKFHPDNKNLPKCNGWCGGYMRASIRPNERSARAMNAHKLELLIRERQENDPLRQFQDLDPEFGLTNHFQIRYPVIEKKSNGKKNSTKEFFIEYSNDGSVEYLFQCSPYVPSPSCSVKFNLSSMPELLVDIKFSRSLVTDWKNIIHLVDSKISSWRPVRVELEEE